MSKEEDARNEQPSSTFFTFTSSNSESASKTDKNRNVKNDTAHIKTCTTSPSSPKPEQHESRKETNKTNISKVSKQTCRSAQAEKKEQVVVVKGVHNKVTTQDTVKSNNTTKPSKYFVQSSENAVKPRKTVVKAIEKEDNDIKEFIGEGNRDKVTFAKSENFEAVARHDEKKQANGGKVEKVERQAQPVNEKESQITTSQFELIKTLQRIAKF